MSKRRRRHFWKHQKVDKIFLGTAVAILDIVDSAHRFLKFHYMMEHCGSADDPGRAVSSFVDYSRAFGELNRRPSAHNLTTHIK